MATITIFEVSDKGITVSESILDWLSGEVLVEADKIFTPTLGLLERFNWAVKFEPVPRLNWALRYYKDLSYLVTLMESYPYNSESFTRVSGLVHP